MSGLDAALDNTHVRLEPLTADHGDAIGRIALDRRIWQWTVDEIETSTDVERYIAGAILLREQGVRFTYAILDKRTGQVAGATSLGNYSDKDRRIEIGWTWLAPSFWGGKTNAGAKALLLSLGFDTLDLDRIEFKTDVLNTRARASLLKLGATQEGVLRSHTLMPGNRRRDTIYYSVLRDEWPTAKLKLDALLSAGGGSRVI